MAFFSSKKKSIQTDNRVSIDSLRFERDLNEAVDIARRTLPDEKYFHFLLKGEEAFENELFDEAKDWWTKVIEESPDFYEVNEAKALLGKLEFIGKSKKDALVYLEKLPELFVEESHSKTFENIHSAYRLFLYLEGMKLKGLCEFENGDLEKSIKTFQTVIDVGYNLCVQKQYVSKQDQPLREIIEDSLYSIPKLYFQLRDIKSTIESLREAINPKYSPSASQKRRISKDLAKVLLYHTQTIDAFYPPLKEKPGSYVPQNAFEEGVYMALKYENELVTAQISKSMLVYNDIIFGCGLHKDYTTITEAIERAILTRSEDPHLWSELALSLISARKYSQSLVVLKEYLEISPNNSTMLLFAAKVCINYLNLYSDAIIYCRKSIDICKENENRLLLARSWHLLGVAYSLAAKTILSIQQHKLHEKAIDALVKALNFGAKDYLFLFHLSLQYAEIREIAKALHHIQRSTTLNPSYAPSWVLYVLLLSSLKKFREASSLCKVALRHHPENLQLLYIYVKLSLELEETSEAFISLRKLCKTIKMDKIYSEDFDEDPTSFGRAFSAEDGQESMISGSAIQQSESNSTTIQENPKPEELSVSSIWLLIAEIFISMKKYQDAENCISEAKKLNPKSAEIYYLNGLILEANLQILDSKEQFSIAVSINSNHLLGNIKLAEYYTEQDQIEVAENILSPLVRKYPSSSRAWYSMGNLLQKKGENAGASDCFLISIELGDTDPIVPFSSITHKIP